MGRRHLTVVRPPGETMPRHLHHAAVVVAVASAAVLRLLQTHQVPGPAPAR